MKKAFLIATLLTAALALLLSSTALAVDGEAQGGGDGGGDGPRIERTGGYPHHGRRAVMNGVTPYGDFCPRCTLYGVGREPVGHGKAVAAMRAYFANKGCTIGNIQGGGRFLKVDVYRNGVLIDRIIFDRRTGRIRSIY